MKVAIIPARGGSKRIPRKNIRLFHGKPIIAYSIEAALASACFDKVIVSTDDEAIAEIARQYGAEVPFIRPQHIADDHATTLDVIQHAIDWCEQQSWNLSYVCCLYATAPFIQLSDLQMGLAWVQQPGVEYVFSATSFPFPIQRAIKLSNSGEVSMFFPEFEQRRSQDLEEAYHDAGQFYWGRAEAFKQRLAIFAPHSRVVMLPRIQVQDIDTHEDWECAEALYAVLKRRP